MIWRGSWEVLLQSICLSVSFTFISNKTNWTSVQMLWIFWGQAQTVCQWEPSTSCLNILSYSSEPPDFHLFLTTALLCSHEGMTWIVTATPGLSHFSLFAFDNRLSTRSAYLMPLDKVVWSFSHWAGTFSLRRIIYQFCHFHLDSSNGCSRDNAALLNKAGETKNPLYPADACKTCPYVSSGQQIT